MINNERWLLPEGIDELLPLQAARAERLRRAILDLYASWGYEFVVTPFIEYLESLFTDATRDLELRTFKLTDQLSGRMMGVRADMTPQVARIDAHALCREVPTRLCYFGTVLHTRPDGFFSSRDPMQVGAELYGHAGVESDLEVVTLMVETLRLCRIPSLHLDLGHIGVFETLVAQAGLAGQQEQSLYDALQRKARPEIEELLAAWRVADEARGMLTALVDLNGGLEVLDEARERLAAAGEPVLEALAYLRRVALAVSERYPDLPLHVDLAELRGYHYHTGLVFAAFTAGHGMAVAQGGRYDDIGRDFGRARPATGFSADLKFLVALGVADTGDEPRGILAPAIDSAALREQVAQLRAAGERVVQALPGQSGGAAEMGCDRVLAEEGGAWTIKRLD